MIQAAHETVEPALAMGAVPAWTAMISRVLGEPAQPSPPSEARTRIAPSMQAETGEFGDPKPKDGQP
jgi:hypothetical protein